MSMVNRYKVITPLFRLANITRFYNNLTNYVQIKPLPPSTLHPKHIQLRIKKIKMKYYNYTIFNVAITRKIMYIADNL